MIADERTMRIGRVEVYSFTEGSCWGRRHGASVAFNDEGIWLVMGMAAGHATRGNAISAAVADFRTELELEKNRREETHV